MVCFVPYQSCQRPDPLLSHLVWWQLSTSEQKRKESSLTDPWCCWGDSGSLDPESPLGKRTWCQSTGNRLKTHSPIAFCLSRLVIGKCLIWSQASEHSFADGALELLCHMVEMEKWMEVRMRHLLTFQQLSWTFKRKSFPFAVAFQIAFYITTPLCWFDYPVLSRNRERRIILQLESVSCGQWQSWLCNLKILILFVARMHAWVQLKWQAQVTVGQQVCHMASCSQ